MYLKKSSGLFFQKQQRTGYETDVNVTTAIMVDGEMLELVKFKTS